MLKNSVLRFSRFALKTSAYTEFFLTHVFVFLNEKFPYAGKGFLISLDLISTEMKSQYL